jgi:ubiquinol-cytochrome c reductase cytochrome b subunit
MASRLMALWEWFDARMPSVAEEWRKHAAEYYAPKNFNFWYYFGVLSMLVLVIQIVSGIFLTMHYKPDAGLAFGSVEYIMRDVSGGWILRYIHSTGASAFFVVVYLHMFRALLYGSHKEPRELIWIFGVLIYLALMAEAFLGYLLPWGQMSYWGAQVIVNLFGVIPFIGPDLALWIRGDYVVSDATLTRFFALHVIAIPLVLLGLVAAHILALHDVGSNNPDGVEIKKTKDAHGRPVDGIPFHPYYTVKDTVGAVVFLAIFCVVMFFMPEMGGYFLEHNNFIPADPLKTPEHIAPLWYFTPYYSILRAVPPLFNSQFPGVLAMGIAVLILFLLPWLDRSRVKSIRYRGPYYKIALAAFVVAFVILGYLGIESTTVWGQFAVTEGSPMDRMLDTKDRATWVARVCTVLYFAFFILMPWYTARDKVKPVPDRVTT